MTAGDTHGHGVPPVTWTFPGRYVSLTTYRQDGTDVATPVWFVQDGGRLLIRTGTASGKAKRIRRNPAVQVTSCSARGQLRGQPVSGVAQFLSGSAAAAAGKLIARKYRRDMAIIRPLWFVQSALHLGRPRSTPVILAVMPG